METKEQPTLSELIGFGTKLTAHFLDGTSTEVLVKQLRIRDLDAWLETAGNEAKKVELYCGQPEGWADNLTIESHEQLLAEGDRLNRPTVARWVKRRRAELGAMQEISGEESPSPVSSSPSAASLAKPLSK